MNGFPIIMFDLGLDWGEGDEVYALGDQGSLFTWDHSGWKSLNQLPLTRRGEKKILDAQEGMHDYTEARAVSNRPLHSHRSPFIQVSDEDWYRQQKADPDVDHSWYEVESTVH
jgi:hypothetical protein